MCCSKSATFTTSKYFFCVIEKGFYVRISRPSAPKCLQKSEFLVQVTLIFACGWLISLAHKKKKIQTLTLATALLVVVVAVVVVRRCRCRHLPPRPAAAGGYWALRRSRSCRHRPLPDLGGRGTPPPGSVREVALPSPAAGPGHSPHGRPRCRCQPPLPAAPHPSPAEPAAARERRVTREIEEMRIRMSRWRG